MISKVFKQDTPLHSLALFDKNSAKRKVFKGLAIRVKNVLIQLETEDKNHVYKT